MNVRDRKRIIRMIEDWKGMLGLSDWHIVLSNEEPESPDRLAQVTQKRDLRVAEVRLRSDVVNVPAIESLCLLHELLHLTPEFDAWDDQLNANAMLEATQRHLLETLLDNCARWILVASESKFPVPSVA